MNRFKNSFLLALLSVLVFSAAACGRQDIEIENKQSINTRWVSQSASYHIGIATIGFGQAEDEMRGAEALVQDFGDAKYGGAINHIIIPDDFPLKQSLIISDIVWLAEDPLMKAIIVNPAVGGTAEAFRRIKEKRSDILLIAGGPQDDPALITSVSDIVVDQDFISRGYYDIVRAKQMDASTFIHMSFPRHMEMDQLSRKRDIYKSICKDLGIHFVDVTTPDPAGVVGIDGSQQAVYDMIPPLIDQYGKDTVFFTTNTAQHEPIIKRVIEYGALFVTTDDASPLVGYPSALGLNLSKEAGDWNKIVDKIEAEVVDKGMSGRMGIYTYSLTYCHSRALGRLAIDILEGNNTGDLMIDITNAYKSFTPGCEWQAGRYRTVDTGEELENFFTLSQDIYILGQGYSGVMNEPIPLHYVQVYSIIGAALLVILLAFVFFRKRFFVLQHKLPTSTNLSNLNQTSDQLSTGEATGIAPTPTDTSNSKVVEPVNQPLTAGAERKSLSPIIGEFKLTSREIEILELLAAGHSTSLIAQDLFISEKTVRVHISNMTTKTNSNSRIDLILLAKHEMSIKPAESDTASSV